ncbi:sugar transferase [Candidatus Sumerlaeota bacterium]|nr:sugar transferase [Candidatus Sumerlaeota bacterium]
MPQWGVTMLKEESYVFGRLNALIDLLLGVGAFFAAYWLRVLVLAPYLFPNVFRPTKFEDQIWLLVLLPPLAVVTLAFNGYYASQRVRPLLDSLRIVVVSVAEATIVATVIYYFAKKGIISRGQVILVPLVLILFVAAKTVAVRTFLMNLRRRGRNFRRVLLVGSGEGLRRLLEILNSHPFWGFVIDGIVTDAPDESPDQGERYGAPVIGGLDVTLGHLWDHQVDEVILVPSHASQSALAPILEGCEEMGIRTHMALSGSRHRIANPVLARFEDLAVVTYSPVQPINWQLFLKYGLDRVLAVFLLIFLSPLLLTISLLIKLTSAKGEPILYGHNRCGLNGKPFTCWKFRSMRVGADAERPALEDRNEMTGPVFKIRDDPRVTPLGRWLRRTSLDELPQLYNVLRGEMSLVGPRPPLPEEVPRYDRWQRRRLSMKPGITCLWQVMGRNRLPFETWMKLDLQYIDNWSLLLDFKILVQTVFAVLTGRGAM